MTRPSIGLLPLYLELYDKTCAENRPAIDAFHQTIARELEKQELGVLTVPVCRLKREFKSAINAFEKAKVDAVVTLHLAYSPSLESSDALASTRLPIIVLNTTPSYAFGPGHDPADIMYNHGIHGVQDMCNLLVRNGKPFKIEAGHWKQSDVLGRVAAWARSARLASAMRNARVGLIGKPFKGMGDFAVPAETLRQTVGVVTLPCDLQAMRQRVARIKKSELEAELAANRKLFITNKPDEAAHRRSALAGLAVRRWIEAEKLTAFTMNFLSVNKASGLPTVPFLEAGMAMARGVGYAGEGDVLTAALVGALVSLYPATTFTEMFCPDWKDDTIFLSHMGEMNIRLAAGKPRLCAPPFPFIDAATPVKPVGRLRAGDAVFVNLAPRLGRKRGQGSTGQYCLIVAPGAMVGAKGEDRMRNAVRGWFRPRGPVADFLADYSRWGGTHHAALVYGDHSMEIAGFGEFMGWETVVLG